MDARIMVSDFWKNSIVSKYKVILHQDLVTPIIPLFKQTW